LGFYLKTLRRVEVIDGKGKEGIETKDVTVNGSMDGSVNKKSS
jgi:hypothetical protein